MNMQGKIEPTLHGALAAAFGEIESATKSANNPHFKSKYADLTTVIEAIKPALIKHGLYFTQRPEPSDKGVTIETVIGHVSGEEMSLGKLFVPANKNDAQGYGSALTYARRYALVTAFGVPVEDDDGNAAAKEQKAAKPDVIDEAQWSELVQLIEATKADTQAFCKAYRIESLRELPAESFERARRQLNTKLAKMTEAEHA